MSAQPAEISEPTPAIPQFEGMPVSRAEVKISGLPTLTTEMPVFSVDDRVRLVVETKCIGVRHVVDPKTGDVVRQQILTVTDAETCPWEVDNPHDDGVIRARG